MMSITSVSEQMVVQELLEQVAAEWDVAHSQSTIVILGNYYPSCYGGTPIVWSGGIVPTVRENHGQVTATIVKV